MKKLLLTGTIVLLMATSASAQALLPKVKTPTYEQIVEDERLQTEIATCYLRIKEFPFWEVRGEAFAECEMLFKQRNVYRASIGLPPITE